jgi:ABC-2 type transport system permease protein
MIKATFREEVYTNLEKSDVFTVITKINDKPITETPRKAVLKGKYQLAIVIPAHLSNDLGQNRPKRRQNPE